MDKPQLLAGFKAQLEAFDKYQGFIDKAREKADKFRPEVVEKVVRDNSEKIAGVSVALEPMVAEVQASVAALTAEKGGLDGENAEARLALEELELRKEIGELDDDTFELEAAPYKTSLGDADLRAALLDEELAELQGLLDAWSARGGYVPAPVVADDDLLGDLEDDVDESAFAGETGRGAAVHLAKVEIADDVSVVFDTKPTVEAEDDEVIEAAEAPAADEGISFGDDELGELAAETPAPKASAADYAGQAVLIMGEGTDEERVFGFEKGAITMGRGRDNTIQVKNDSKVSRYHCKVFKRDSAYFIEDNKSANGTLVDQELITEKRLTGGEEIIVGETFFRFRVNA